MFVGVRCQCFDTRLKGLRFADVGERLLEIVRVVGEMRGEVIEQIGVERRRLHRVRRMNDASAHQSMPQAIDDRPRKSAIPRMRHQPGELSQAVGLRQRRVDLA